MIPISDLLKPITADEQLETFLTTLETLGVPARKWRQGGVARTILRVIAISFAGFSSTMAAGIGAGFLETATGAWLVLLAYYVYGVVAIPATQATGQLVLFNNGGGLYTYPAGKAFFLNPVSKVTYTNAADFTLNPLSNLTIDIIATTFGAATSSTPTTITQLVTSMLKVECTNPEAVIGQDAERDEDLRVRCFAKLATLSVRGPRNAYVYAAKSAKLAGGAPVNINRVSVSTSSSTGHVQIYCATPTGTPLSVELDAVRANIEAIARPDGVTATTSGVTSIDYTASITVFAEITTGVSAADVQAAAATAIATFIENYPIGGLTNASTGLRGLFGSGITSVIGAASPAKVFAVLGAAGGNDLALALTDGQVARDAVTIAVQLQAAA